MDEIALEQHGRPQWAFHNLMRAHRLAHAALFDRLDLRDVGQPMLLFLLDDAHRDGRACTQKGLGAALRLSASTVTASIKSLERHGYVRRHADERDQRRNIVEITEAGRETARACRRAFADIDEAMYRGFSEAERREITGLFARMTKNLYSLREGSAPDNGEVCKCSENSSNS
ncbi:MAG: MarR family transcriptional regulator [Butyricicoccus sp.]|nr:MarR family transcriptional regulator [Butyricicoccus sp.]